MQKETDCADCSSQSGSPIAGPWHAVSKSIERRAKVFAINHSDRWAMKLIVRKGDAFELAALLREHGALQTRELGSADFF